MKRGSTSSRCGKETGQDDRQGWEASLIPKTIKRRKNMQRISFAPNYGTSLQAQEWIHRCYTSDHDINQRFVVSLAQALGSSHWIGLSLEKEQGRQTRLHVEIYSEHPEIFEQVELQIIALENAVEQAKINADLLAMVGD
jgi:hypothetical protein